MSSSLETRALAVKYSDALYETAMQQNSVVPVANVVDVLRVALSESVELQQFLHHKMLPNALKKKALLAVLGEKNSTPLFTQFLEVLAQNNRLPLLDAVTKAFYARHLEQQGVMVANVTTALPLSVEDTAVLTQNIEKKLGKKVQLAVAIKPAVLGGLSVKIGSKFYDATLATQIQRLRTHLLTNIV